MLFARFKCPQCGQVFRVLRLMTNSGGKRKCPSCGTMDVPPVEEDARLMLLEEKEESCSSFG